MRKKAILLINLGTPENCDEKSVKKYLRQFLNDNRVVDLPVFIRWPLVNLLIVPFRYKKTTAAYKKIWTETGSPLLSISKAITNKLSAMVGEDYQVELGMRYGQPDIPSAIEKLEDCDSITVIPLFPQYSSAATGSAIEETLSRLSGIWNFPALQVYQDFYEQPWFIQSVASNIKNSLTDKTVDKIIFSYHGLPERHVIKSGCAESCNRIHACPSMIKANRFCYRAQCYATTTAITDKLGLSQENCIVSFQSRLGRTPWIKPYTDLLLPDLIKQGVKNIAVVSPSFIADCLETLEEINIRMKQQWLELGGENFIFIPCINTNDDWIKGLADSFISLNNSSSD